MNRIKYTELKKGGDSTGKVMHVKERLREERRFNEQTCNSRAE